MLTESVAIVNQKIVLFTGTIRANLTLWNRTPSDAAMIDATQTACIHDTILSWPLGYDTPIEVGGANLSGGQQQLLDIARALITKPRLLILDEATSALDSQTETSVSDNIRQQGCSCLIIAHRLGAMVKTCDEIIVLNQGQVMQRGTHQALKDGPGLYAQLLRAQ